MEDPIALREHRERELALLIAEYRARNGNQSRQPAPARRRTARDRQEFAPWDVKAVREVYEQTQAQFAQMMGISVRTLRNWEQGTRFPQGPARALLRLAAADPDAVRKVLSYNRVRERAEAKWME